MILRNRFFLKSIALFLAIEILSSSVGPTLSYALTSGPTAPEATSFEPVDTTDMVNLATGDFTYNLPLLEVPGPSGSYPLSLSYHAGIFPDEEASWVGLGWTLNPGAISRTVNGFPDDQTGAKRVRKDYWSGGEQYNFYVGIGYPGVSYNLTVSHDTYTGTTMGVGMMFGQKIGPFEIGAEVGISPNGEGYANATASIGPVGVKAGTSGVSGYVSYSHDVAGATATVGFTTNFKTVSPYASLSAVKSLVATRINISSKGLKASMSVAGNPFQQSNYKAGKVTVESNGFAVPIPIGAVILTVGYNYKRYYSKEKDNVWGVGTLHAKDAAGKNIDDYSFDSYALLDPDQNGGSLNINDPERARGGSFPAYDDFSVSAQGLGGTIQPYILQNMNLYRQNLKKQGGGYEIEYKTTNTNYYGKVNFRFKNDFSNTHGYSTTKMELQSPANSLYFYNSLDNLTPPEGRGPGGHLAGSKHIEWFTNKEIKDGVAKGIGFIDYQPYANRAVAYATIDIQHQAGGFMITNESGVTYHYALPAYAYDEYSKSFVKGKINSNYQSNTNSHPYAYTWFLTAVTGPDYVDRNSDGRLDQGDWGYWVRFDYDAGPAGYKWRNPGVGYHDDIDSNLKFYSSGSKEIYNLDRIVTKSHTAYFVKDYRSDGRSVTDLVNGGFLPKSPTGFPANKLKLSSIYLIENKRIDEASTTVRNILNAEGLTTSQLASVESDVRARSSRLIDFQTDQSLAPGTLNSFDLVVNNGVLSTNPQDYVLKGKLTLKAISFKGKGGYDALPPIRFEYDKNPAYNKDAHDIWGFYKSNFDPTEIESISHFVDSKSAKDIDAWSLSRIHTSLGSTIDISYESDSYNKPVLYDGHNFTVQSMRALATQGDVEIEITGNTENLDSYFNIGDIVDLISLHKSRKSFSYLASQTICVPATPQGYLIDNYAQINRETKVKATRISGNKFYMSFSLPEAYARYVPDARFTNIIPNTQGSYVYFCDNNVMNNPGTNSQCQRQVYVDTSIPPDGIPDSYETQYYTGSPMFCTFSTQEIENNFTFSAGNIAKIGAEGDYAKYGGGLRVAAVTLNSMGKQFTTHYNYNIPGSAQTSGTTSFEPNGVNQATYLGTVAANVQLAYEKELNRRFLDLLLISRELPGPGILYQYVTVSETITEQGQVVNLPGKKLFEFEMFKPEMIVRVPMQSSSNPVPVTCYNSNHQIVACDPDWGSNCDPVGGGPQNPTVVTGNPGKQTAPAGVQAQAQDYPCNPATQPVECYDSQGRIISCTTYPSTSTTPIMISDFTGSVGIMKSMTLYGADDVPLQKTSTVFLHDQKSIAQLPAVIKSQYKNQGVITQLFNEYRKVDGNHYRIFCGKRDYPVIPVQQVSIDYKHGITKTSSNLEFDFFSGAPTKVMSVDGYGNSYITETVPAYKIPQYSGMTSAQVSSGFTGMGLKVLNKKNRHMLTQTAATYTYKALPQNSSLPIASDNYKPVGLVSASAQTWSDLISVARPEDELAVAYYQPGIWRTHASYSFIGDQTLAPGPDGLYPLSTNTLPQFSSWQDIRNGEEAIPTGWEKDGETTLYNVASHGLEAKNFNGKYMATRMSLDQRMVMATAINARYDEFAYTGAEELGTLNRIGAGIICTGLRTNLTAHTGAYSVKATAQQRALVATVLAKKGPNPKMLRVSAWVKAAPAQTVILRYRFMPEGVGPDIENQDVPLQLSDKKEANDWYLCTALIRAPQSAVAGNVYFEAGIVNGSSADIYVDDFRINAMDADMTSYVYNVWGEASHIIDDNNMYTEFRYDQMGRLKETFKETFSKRAFDNPGYGVDGIVKVSQVEYNHAEKNPYQITITSSKIGPSGSISPSTSVQQGADAVFQINETCLTYPYLRYIRIDGNIISLVASQLPLTLVDGTKVYVTGGGLNGRVVRFENVASSHSIQAEFTSSPPGYVRCYSQVIDGVNCYNGSYRYAFFDACGNAGPEYSASNASQVPANLQQYVQQCCPGTGGPGPVAVDAQVAGKKTKGTATTQNANVKSATSAQSAVAVQNPNDCLCSTGN